MKTNILNNMVNNIRVWAIMMVCLTMFGVGNAWGTDWSCTFSSTPTWTGTGTTRSMTASSATWSVSTSNENGSPTTWGTYGSSNGSGGIKFGDSKSNYYGTITLSTDYFSSSLVSEVTVNLLINGSVPTTITVTQGVTIGSPNYSTGATWHDFTANTNVGTSGTLTLAITTTQAIYIHSITVTYAAAIARTVTFNKQGGTCETASLKEASAGAGVTLPAASPSSACASEGWGFYGWATSAVGISTTSAPAIVGKAGDTYHPTDDITLHAVYAQGEYTKETSAITSGAKYLIVANSGGHNHIMKSSSDDFQDYSGYNGMAAIQIDETSTDKYHAASVNATWCYSIEGTAGNYFIRDVVNSSSSNYADIAFSAWWGHAIDNDDKYTITVSSGIWTIQNNYYDDGYTYLGYDSSDDAFFGYGSAQDILLYKAGTINYYSTPSCCDKEVALSYNSAESSHVSAMTFSETNLATCSGTAGDREVTVTVTPSTGYLFKSGDELTWTKSSGTIPAAPTKVSGPTLNAGKYEFVYRFAQDDNGAGTFAATASTYTNYRTNCGYTITYECNDADSGCPDDVEQTFNLPNPLPTTPTKTGYDFSGWYTNEGLTDAAVAGAEINDDVTLYAKWTAKTYTLTLDNEEGTGAASVTAKYNSSTLTGWSVPTKTGYTFGGYWSGDNGTGTLVISTSGVLQNSVTISAVNWTDASGNWVKDGGVTLYAKWTATSYTLSYDLAGGSVASPNPTSYTIESAAITLNNPTKTGYTFTGWTGTGLASATTTVTIAAGSTGDRSYTATWTANEYTASNNLDKNGGSANGKYTATYDATTIAINTTPTRTGYSVEGYYKEAECTNKVAAADGTLQVSVDGYTNSSSQWVATSAPKLYTNWTANEYVVSLDQNGATTSGSTSVTMTYNSAAHTAITNPEKTGYTFKGWYTGKASGSIIIKTDGTLSNKSGYVSSGVWIRTTATTLYARWTQSVTLNKNGGSKNGKVTATYYGAGPFTVTAPTRAGYSVEGYYAESACTHKVMTDAGVLVNYSGWVEDGKWIHSGTSTLYTKWTEDTHTVTVAAGANGSVDHTSVSGVGITTASGDITATPNTGYHFDNWTLPDGVTAASTYSATSNPIHINATADDLTITANFAANVSTITWNPNGAGASVTPTSSSYTYDGSTVDLPTPTRSLYAFDGWYTEASGGTQITEVGTTNKPTANVEYFAHWRALTFEVKDQAGTGTADIHLTSTRGVTVYATSACGNLITIKADNLDAISNLGGGTANKQNIQIKYLDANNGDAVVENSKSPFRLCNNGSSNYNNADGSNINLNGLTEYSQTYSISYTPTAYGVTDHYKLQLRLQNNNTNAITITFDLYGRSLPDEFVIAAKSGSKWYALPNNLAGTQGEQNSIVPVEISVDNTSSPTRAMNVSSTVLYRATDRYTTANKSGIRFTNDGSHWLQTSSTASVYKMWLSGSGGTNAQDWYLKSSNFGAYEVMMDPIGSPTDARRIELYESYIGYHGSRTGTGNIYFLPVEYTDMSAEIMEWGTDHVVVDLRSAGSATKVKTQVGQGALSSAQTLASIKKDEGVYRVAVTLSESDAAKNLKLLFYNDSEVMQGGAKNTIPLLISDDDATTGSLSLSKDDAATCDLVVLDGGVLTVSETTDGAKYTFQDLYVYGGGKMVVPSGRYISFSNVYMRGGHLNSSWEYQYSNPQLILNGTMGNSSNTINYDYLTNNAQFYSLALPYQVQLANIVNPYFNNKRSWEIHAYDGAKRASGSQVDGWYDVEVGSTGANTGNIAALTSSSYLTPGVGYTFWGAMQKVNSIRQKWSINRFPMTLASGSAETAKAGVSVGAYGMTDGMPNDGVAVNDAGWNMLGNPYLANIGGTESFESSLSALIVGYHNEKELDGSGNWTGAWKEVEDAANVRYVRIPHDNGMDYDQVRVKDATFKSFRHFFIQAATSGTFTFSLSQRAQEAPARVQNNGATLPDEMDIDFILSNGEEQATFGLTVNDKLNTGFVVGEDMPEELGGTSSKAYTIAAENKLAYNGLPSTAAEQYIPVGYRAEAAGTYTFAYKPDEYTTYIEHIRLIDYATGDVTDLLDDTYEFSTEQGIFDERFALNVEFVRYNTPTGMEGIGINADQPVKFIRDDKMYILRNGVIYDATGKRVIEINK